MQWNQVAVYKYDRGRGCHSIQLKQIHFHFTALQLKKVVWARRLLFHVWTRCRLFVYYRRPSPTNENQPLCSVYITRVWVQVCPWSNFHPYILGFFIARDIALFYTVVVINLLKVVTSVAELQGVDKLGRMIWTLYLCWVFSLSPSSIHVFA
jgi:hypothetical protein